MPTGFHIASAWVDIRAEDRGLRSEVRNAVEKAARGQNFRIPVKVDSKGLRNELTRAVRAAERGQVARINARIDSRGLRRELNRAVQAATRGQGVRVPLRVNSAGFRAEVGRAVRAAQVGQAIRIPVRANSAGLRAEVSRAARAASVGQAIRIPVHARSAGLRAEVTRAVRVAQAGQRVVIPVRANTRQLRTEGTRDVRQFSNVGRRAMRTLQWGGRQATNSIMGISRIGLRSLTSSLPGAVAAAVGGLQLIGAAANVASAVIGAALPMAFVAVGAFALRNSKKVKNAFQDMSRGVSRSLRRAAQPLEGALVRGMRLVGREVRKMEGQLKRAFRATAPLVKPLVQGITGLVRNALPGMTRALQRSLPLMQGFRDGLRKIGQGIGQMFDEMTKNGGAKAIGEIWRVLGEGIRMVLKELGVMFRTLAKDKDVVDTLRQGFQLLVGVIRVVTWLIKGLANAAAFLRNPIKGIIDLIHDVWNWIKKLSKSKFAIAVKDKATKVLKGVWNFLKRMSGYVARAGVWVKDKATAIAKKAWGWIKKFAGFVGRGVIWLKDKVTSIAKKAWGLLKRFAGWVGRAAIWVRDQVSKIARRAWGLIKRFAGWVGRAAIRLKDWVSQKAKQAWGLIKRFAGWVGRAAIRLADGISRKARQAWGLIKRFAGWVGRAAIRLRDGVSNLAKKAWGWLKRIAGYVARAALKATDGITAVAKRVVGWLKRIVSKSITLSVDLVGDAVGKIGDLLGFAKGGIVRFAGGGNVSGPGTGTSDSILAAVSNGEFVMRADAVKKFGVPFMNSVNQGKLNPSNVLQGLVKGQIPGFASGGSVSGSSGGGVGSSSSGDRSVPSAPAVPKVQPMRGGGAKASLTATDDTEPAITSASKRFESFKKVIDLTYQGINRSSTLFGSQQKLLMTQMGTAQKMNWDAGLRSMSASSVQSYNNITRATQQFGTRQQQRLAMTRGQSLKVWNGWRTGMQQRTSSALDGMAKRTGTWGRFTENRLRNTRSGTHKIWTNWRTGMQGRTDSAMDNMRKRVTTGGNQVESRFKGARSSTHKIWTNWRTGMQGRTDSALDNMRKRVTTGGNQIEGKFRSTRSQSHKVWTNWRTGMQGRTDSALDNMRKRVQSGGNQIESKFRGTRSQSHKTWTNWRTGMQGRTDSAMDNMNKRTNKFKGQITNTFQSAQKSVGKAWNNVRPKLAAPIKYLTGKVINRGVVPAMNKVVSQLGGSAKLSKVSTGGFATGGYVSGPGGPTSDSIPARLSNGEYVIRASSVRKYGVGYLNQVNRGAAMPNAAPVRRAMGGLVGTANRARNGIMNFAKGGLAAVTGASKGKLENLIGDFAHEDYEKLAEWIWDTAINPLVNSAPGGPMMDTVLDRASILMRKNAVKWLESNIFPMGEAYGFKPAPPWKPGDGQRVNWRGITVNRRTAGMLNESERKFKKGRINPTQGSYSTRVAASGSTHAGGGAVDVGPASNALVGAMRSSGFAAWKRTRSEGPWAPHIHAIAVGDPTASPAAKAQVRQFFNGLNGLGKPDTFGGGINIGGKGVQRWRALAIRAMRMGGLKVTGYTIGRFLSLMRQESGGNPRAINGWDSNARAGNASRGLMQVIPTTFRANHVKGTSWNIYDPLANMAAAARYIKRRYGGRVPNSPYREGGLVEGPGASTRDKIPAMLSNGEFVMNARAVQKHGMNFMNQLNGGVNARMSKGGAIPPGVKGVPRYLGPEYFAHAQKFASGGPVGSTSSGSSSGTTYRIKQGDTLSEIAEKFNTTVGKLVDLNDIQNKHLIYAGDLLKITADSTEATTLYTIKWGDTLSEIAAKHGTTVDELMRLNTYIRDADLIFAGKTLRLPGSDNGSTPGTGTPPVPLPFDQLPPYVFPHFRTTKPEQFESDEAKKALNQLVYIPWEQQLAGMTESQVVTQLKAQDTLETLIGNIATLKETVRAAFKGDDKDVHQKDMIDRIHLATAELSKWQKQLDAGAAAFEAATASVEELQSSFDGMKDSTMEAVKSFASVTKIGQWGTNVNVLIGQLETDLGKAEDFANSIEQLKAKGVNSDMLGQIVEAGITGGGLATAHTLLRASPEDIARLNALQEQINAVADRAGTAAAEGMYGAGLQAAKGLLAGMEAERAQIEAYMLKIAKAMELSIKQALGIKSPSRVFMKVGEMATLGMVHGMGNRIGDVVSASQAVGSAAIGGASKPVTSAPASGIVVGRGDNYQICVHVDGTFDLSIPGERRRVAALLARDVKEEIRKDDRRRR